MSAPRWFFPAGLNSFGGNFGAALGAQTGGVTPASAAWPVANDAMLIPFSNPQAVLIKRLVCVNGTAVSGNVDVGIYSADGARISSAGTTAQSGTNALQFFDVTDFTLAPGRYYWALAADNTSATFFRGNPTVARLGMLGAAKMASAFVLPATVTFATVTSAYLPLVGAEIYRLL